MGASTLESPACTACVLRGSSYDMVCMWNGYSSVLFKVLVGMPSHPHLFGIIVNTFSPMFSTNKDICSDRCG